MKFPRGRGGYYLPAVDVLGHHQNNFFSCHHRYVRTFWCYILLYFHAVFEHVLWWAFIEIDRLSSANYDQKTIFISFPPPPYFLPGKMSRNFNFYRCSKKAHLVLIFVHHVSQSKSFTSSDFVMSGTVATQPQLVVDFDSKALNGLRGFASLHLVLHHAFWFCNSHPLNRWVMYGQVSCNF